MKVGLLGGSFDPIHTAHMEMAKQASKQLPLDEVWFLVAKDTPLKQRLLTPFTHRCEMVEKAIAAYTHYRICTIENEIDGKSYTVDTVRKLRQYYPDFQFFFMIGQDQVAQLHLWKAIDELQNMVSLCAFERNEQAIHTPYRVQALSMPHTPVSSTSIREGNFIHLHPNVRKYCVDNMLYMHFVKDAMSEYRYTHSVSVAQLCVQIARKQGLDTSKAYLCGLLHDINKEFTLIDLEASKQILSTMRPQLLSQHPNIWHGYLGRFICEHSLHISDKDILLAIENHVLGECRNIYAMLLYVADKLDPLRDYDTTDTIKVCEQDLYKGFQLVKAQQEEFYGEKNENRK